MTIEKSKFDHLWNDLPDDETERLMPHMIESQIRHIEQCKAIAVRAHKKHMIERNGWIGNLRNGLKNK